MTVFVAHHLFIPAALAAFPEAIARVLSEESIAALGAEFVLGALLKGTVTTEDGPGVFGFMVGVIVVAVITREYLRTAAETEPAVGKLVMLAGTLVRKRIAYLNYFVELFNVVG